jgi:hypothetical protein
MKMKNEVKDTRARSKTLIRPEDEEKIKEERNDEKDRFESFIDLEQMMQKLNSLKQNQEYCGSVVLVAKL